MTAAISWDNYVDDATVTQANGTVALPIANIKTRQISDIARYNLIASPLKNWYVRLDLGSAKTTKVVGFINHNMPGVSYLVRFGTSLGGVDVGEVSGNFALATDYDAPNDFLYFPTGYTAQWIDIIFLVPGKICDIGRIWVGDAWSPSISMDFSMGIIDRSPKAKSRGGDTWDSKRQILRTMDVNAVGTSTADFIGTASNFDSLLTMDLAVGTHDEIVCLPLTDSQHNLNRLGIYGTIKNNNPIQVRDKGADGFLTSKRFTIEEDRA